MQKENTQSIRGTVTTIYCLCDDFLKAIDWQDDVQARITTAQVMTVAITGAALFHGNQEASRRFLRKQVDVFSGSKSTFSDGAWLYSKNAQ